MTLVWVGLCGIAGTLGRYAISQWLNPRASTAFPWGTWVINALGSLLLGILYGLHSGGRISELLWLTAGTGFCGAFTTFSTFGFETIRLVTEGRKRRAALYVLSSAALGVLCVYIGIKLPLL